MSRFGGVLIGAVLALVASSMALAQYNSANYMEQGGARWVVGGTLDVVSGAVFRLDNGTKTAAATSGAATLSKLSGVVTSEALTTAAGATYSLVVTNTRVAAADVAFASVSNGTNTTGAPVVQTVTPGSGTLTIVVRNSDASAAFNGTIRVAFAVLKN